MKKQRKLIYINADIKNNKFIYSGIDFSEYIAYLSKPIENLMIISGGSDVILLETEFDRGFELFEGRQLIQKLAKENVYSFGNFCFLDYCESHRTYALSEEQIAELLYLGHMFKPLKTPFFKELQNRFAYLSHDDGFFCKLYCCDINDFLDIFNGKIVNLTSNITKKAINKISDKIQEELLQLAENGLMLDFDDININDDKFSVTLYSVGKYVDIDDVLNERKRLKDYAKDKKNLNYECHEWFLNS